MTDGLICVNGTAEIYVHDGKREQVFELSDPAKCLLLDPRDWHTMTIGAGAALLVLASHPYDKLDYIDEPYK